jgi:hypothetical protein
VLATPVSVSVGSLEPACSLSSGAGGISGQVVLMLSVTQVFQAFVRVKQLPCNDVLPHLLSMCCGP